MKSRIVVDPIFRYKHGSHILENSQKVNVLSS